MLVRINQILVLPILFLGMLGIPQAIQAQKNIIQDDWPMFADPVMVHEEKILVVAEKLIPTWMDALTSGSVEIRIDAAQTLRIAALKKLPGLDVAIDPLIAAVADRENSKTIRYTAASALVLLDAVQAKEVFLEGIEDGEFEMSMVTEAALIRWEAEEMLERWRSRMGAGKADALLRFAFAGLARNGTDEDREMLVAYCMDQSNSHSLRLEAAEAIGRYAQRPYLTEADELKSGSAVDLIIAASLSSPTPAESDKDQALQLLRQLSASTSYVAAGIAAEALLESDRQSVVAMADVLEAHRNLRARRAYVTALYETITADSLPTLASYLDDPDPQLRIQVRQWLIELAEQETLRSSIVKIMEEAVNAESWRIQEQALQIAVALDQEQVAPVALQLLRSKRGEVLVTAGWALRRLAVPETLAPALAYCDSLKVDFLGEKLPRDLEYAMNEQFAHLYQMFGQMMYKPASELLQRFTRKEQTLRFRLRASAAWALGKIWEGDLTGNPEVEKLLYTRLTDEAPVPPEDVLVKRMCAISLARIGSDSDETIAALRKYLKDTERGGLPSFNPLHTGAAWALNKLTGEQFPDPLPEDFNEGPWLLEPFDPQLLENN